MKRDGLLLAALPSGGSDWIAECIARANLSLKYTREFFCPTTNWRMARQLESVLGDTMFSNVPRLCQTKEASEIETLIEGTWRKTGHSFTKENYIPFQLQAFSEFFDVIVLVRSFEETFPPNRHRVMRWYEHFFGALAVNGMLDSFCSQSGQTPMLRAAIGHYFFARKLVDTAKTLSGVPLLRTGSLLISSESEIAKELSSSPINANLTAAEIVRTRQVIHRPRGEYAEQWHEAFLLYKTLVAKYGAV